MRQRVPRMTSEEEVTIEKRIDHKHIIPIYFPSFKIIFSVLVIIRLIAAAIAPISDCDEVFNYWEPTHFLLYGRGFQTWEYAPQYALRSYIYPTIHQIAVYIVTFPYSVYHYLTSPVHAFSFVGGETEIVSKINVFYLVRALLAVASGACESALLIAVKERMGASAALLAAGSVAFNSGLFFACSAFLPSQFAAMFVTLATACLLLSWPFCSMFCAAVAILIGWPFVALALSIHAIFILISVGFLRMLLAGIVMLTVLLGISAVVDYWYYGKWIIAIFNIFVYNATSSDEAGGQLYGVEPFHFYFKNLVIHFNIFLPLALASLPLALLFRRAHNWKIAPLCLLLLPIYLWLGFFSYLPHKEERFMFPIYPLLCVAGGISIVIFTNLIMFLTNLKVNKILPVAFLAIYILLSLSRIVSTQNNYSAPIQIYTELYNRHHHFHHDINQNNTYSGGDSIGRFATICTGKEWYRFPSSFFLAEGENNGIKTSLEFLKSSFDGQLPTHYPRISQPLPVSYIDLASSASMLRPSLFNSLNREQFDRYVNITQCNYMVDLEVSNQNEQRFSSMPDWEIIESIPFLDAPASKNTIARSFFIPFYSNQHNVYAKYLLLRKKS